MRFAILGAGGIGAYLGARLATAGEDVVLVARGDHQRAMAARGVQVHDAEGTRTVKVPALAPNEPFAPADVVVITAKAHDIEAMLPQIRAAGKPNALVVAAQNGIPWWYFQRHGGELEDTVLESVDPGGLIAKAIDPDRVVGCVIYCPITLMGPGIVEHQGPKRLEIGRPDGKITPELNALAEAFERAGFSAPRSENVRKEIWIKLLGNAPLNPIGALVRKTSGEVVEHPAGHKLVGEIMYECVDVAKSLGIDVSVSVEARLAQIPTQVGRHKSSMLQDVEKGRRVEIDGLVGAVVELGDRLGVDVKALRYVYMLAQML
ncbi:MAG: 2-dehydropantoate 2-reductase [Vulcanimicrobiaceae bacterium]|jgi:2-dehydropantoate 2-reductase